LASNLPGRMTTGVIINSRDGVFFGGEGRYENVIKERGGPPKGNSLTQKDQNEKTRQFEKKKDRGRFSFSGCVEKRKRSGGREGKLPRERGRIL